MSTRVRFAIVCTLLLAIAATAYADSCVKFTKTQCSEVGEACGCPLGETNACFLCQRGSYCGKSNVCLKQAAIGEACKADAECYNPANNGQVICVGGTCLVANIIAAGEKCTNGTQFVNGGCRNGLSCDGTCQPYAAEGEECFSDAVCARGFVCRGHKCQKLFGKGAACESDSYCGTNLICSASGTCQERHTRKEYQTCKSFYDCEVGLGCGEDKICIKPDNLGHNCTDKDDCASGSSCRCDYTKGYDTCQLMYPLDFYKKSRELVNDYFKCYAKHPTSAAMYDETDKSQHCIKEAYNVNTHYKSYPAPFYCDYKDAKKSAAHSLIAPSFVSMFLLVTMFMSLFRL